MEAGCATASISNCCWGGAADSNIRAEGYRLSSAWQPAHKGRAVSGPGRSVQIPTPRGKGVAVSLVEQTSRASFGHLLTFHGDWTNTCDLPGEPLRPPGFFVSPEPSQRDWKPRSSNGYVRRSQAMARTSASPRRPALAFKEPSSTPCARPKVKGFVCSACVPLLAARHVPSAPVSSVEARRCMGKRFAACMVPVVVRQLEAEMEILKQVPSRRRGCH